MVMEKVKLLGLAVIAGAALAAIGVVMAADAALALLAQSIGLQMKVSLFELVAITPNYWGRTYRNARA